MEIKITYYKKGAWRYSYLLKKSGKFTKNISGDRPFFLEGGGLYMAIRWVLMLLNVMAMFIYSKELKIDVG